MRYILLFLLAIVCVPIHAQYNDVYTNSKFIEPRKEVVTLRNYDDKKLAEYRTEKRFQYDKVIKEEKKQQNDWLTKALLTLGKWLASVGPSAKTADVLGNAFVYGIAILALGLIIWGIFKMRIRTMIAKTAEPLNFDFKEVESDILLTDFEKYLREAVNAGNYKRAVQLLYLESLKSLTLNNIIQWKPNKTNQEYLYEMQNSNLRRPFMDITRLFEYIFYGEFPINQQTYQATEAAFQDFQGKIATK